MKSFSILSIRLLAFYLMLETFYNVFPILFSSNAKEMLSGDSRIILLASVVVPFFGGFLLWFAAPRISRKLHIKSNSEIAINDEGFVSAGLFLIGIFMVIRHIGILAGNYSVLKEINIGSIIVIVICIFLILGNAFFTKLYRKIKYVDQNT